MIKLTEVGYDGYGILRTDLCIDPDSIAALSESSVGRWQCTRILTKTGDSFKVDESQKEILRLIEEAKG